MAARSGHIRFRTVAAALSLALLATGCGIEQTADQLARAQARAYITKIIAIQFPGVDASPITDCVIDNATTVEAITIAQAAALGGNQAAVEAILGIAARPETTACIATRVLAGAAAG